MFHRHLSDPSLRMSITAHITDNDKDIDSVYIKNDYFQIKEYLRYNIESDLYELSLTSAHMNINSLEEIIGHNFNLMVTDKFNNVFELGQKDLKRIIYNQIQYESPSSYQLVSSTPQLKWYPIEVEFNFTYRIEIFTDELHPQMVWEKDNIPADSTSFTVDRPLQQNEYFWIIWCVDEFQNRASSKAASFKVE